MKKMLVTGGTVFVSRYIAEYYAERDYEVYVLNRNTKEQPENVTLIEANRNNLGAKLKNYHFDVVLDVTAYTKNDISSILDGLGAFEEYIMISSSAVYPETGTQPFTEDGALAENKFWGQYGTDKIEAERELLSRVSKAYIIRPPYLYGPMNNVYREAFVFECALKDRAFWLPRDGEMRLQFFYVRDLCRLIEQILEQKPEYHIFNVGNMETVSIREWVKLCYKVAGKTPKFVNVHENIEQRKYFPFYDYEYYLDVKKQYELIGEVTPLEEGLKESLKWYLANSDKVNTKPFISYIEENFKL